MTKIEAARLEYKSWCSAVGINTIEDLNETLRSGRGIEFINLCEARGERKYAEIATGIYYRRAKSRIVLMSGPSSSGKTSSALRIAQQCKVLGLNPKVIELDNYFVNREDTPLDENGKPDFESLYAMDIDYLNLQLNQLLAGKEIELPRYDFQTGRRVPSGKTICLGENDILCMEGIHALNPALTPSVDQSRIFRIYISALNALPSNTSFHVSTSNKRLLRRILRDSRTRNIPPEKNIMMWPSVRRGEEKNIFPYEENADMVFNSSLLYDMPMLKFFAEPVLRQIPESSPAYPKAKELLKYTSMFVALTQQEIDAIPPTSIMREFIGGQTL